MIIEPIFVCTRCGKIVRTIEYEAGECYKCCFCGYKMTKTRFSISEYENYLLFDEGNEALNFRRTIYTEYVKNNTAFNRNIYNHRLIKKAELLKKYDVKQ